MFVCLWGIVGLKVCMCVVCVRMYVSREKKVFD